MRVTTIISEAWRNVLTGTARTVQFALLLGAILGGLTLADAMSVRTIEQQADSFQASGAATRILRAEGSVNGTMCDSLTGTNTITAAGALTPADPMEFAALPTTSIPAFQTTPGLIHLLGGNADRAGAWIPEKVAQTLQISPGGQLPSSTGLLTIAGTYAYPEDGRDSRLAFAVLLPSATRQAWDECWAAAWPLSEETDALLRSSAYAGPGSQDALQIGQLNKTHGSDFDGPAAFDNRITRFAYPLLAVVGVALGWVSIRMRRLEHAAALHAGQKRSEQLATILLETITWTILGTTLASVGVALWLTTVPNPTTLTGILAPAAPIAFAATLIGAALGSAATRERHLFRYFKERA